MGFADVDETTWLPALHLLPFLSLPLLQSLWPGYVAAHWELQAEGHVLWSPQRVEAMLHGPAEVFSALFVIHFISCPKAPLFVPQMPHTAYQENHSSNVCL